ncbi:ankyrin repeat domain-containing protein [Aspergillus stella-maris]|uniref:ankyrin repeat domain-containing protein n=1 Tax=Aspergillus stella-maris TaxID=1810926 RepID=UPI003CCDD736
MSTAVQVSDIAPRRFRRMLPEHLNRITRNRRPTHHLLPISIPLHPSTRTLIPPSPRYPIPPLPTPKHNPKPPPRPLSLPNPINPHNNRKTRPHKPDAHQRPQNRKDTKSVCSGHINLVPLQLIRRKTNLHCGEHEDNSTALDKTNTQLSGAKARNGSLEQEVKDEKGSEDDESDSDEDDKGHSYSEIEEELSGGGSPFRYPVTEWIEHALRATADIVDNLGVADVFWLLGSKDRAEWYRRYTEFTSSTETRYASLPNFDGNSTALRVAAFFGYVPLTNLLLRSDQHEGELRASDERGMQPLYWACRKGHLDKVQRLCAAGADINFQSTEEHQTALHGAVLSEIPEITSFLLNYGAHVNCSSEEFGSPLYMAYWAESLPIVQQLFEKGADPNIVGGRYSLPLNSAAASDRVDTAKLLLENEAKLNPAQNFTRGHALCAACYFGTKDMAEYLLQQGCSWDIENWEKVSPLEMAAREGYDSIASLLLEYDKRP